jgi:hypothetical protein
MRESRRAAKIANILGVNERKDILQVNNPEISTIVSMLNSSSDSQNGVIRENLHENRIFQEGYLQIEENLQTKAKARIYWCSIENGTFRANCKEDKHRASKSLNLEIEEFEVSKTNGKKNTFELCSKSNPSEVYHLTADTSSVVDTWVEAFRNNSKLMRIMAKKHEKSIPGMSMNDFEIHRVLGRGKFGKVLQAS